MISAKLQKYICDGERHALKRFSDIYKSKYAQEYISPGYIGARGEKNGDNFLCARWVLLGPNGQEMKGF